MPGNSACYKALTRDSIPTVEPIPVLEPILANGADSSEKDQDPELIRGLKEPKSDSGADSRPGIITTLLCTAQHCTTALHLSFLTSFLSSRALARWCALALCHKNLGFATFLKNDSLDLPYHAPSRESLFALLIIECWAC